MEKTASRQGRSTPAPPWTHRGAARRIPAARTAGAVRMLGVRALARLRRERGRRIRKKVPRFRPRPGIP